MSGRDELDKRRGVSGEHHPPPPPPPQYGTFQPYPPPEPQPPSGFPQPVPPPGSAEPPPPPPPQYYAQGYQAVPGYAVAEGIPVRQRRLRCCGLGCGWCLFILGFFLAAIPWYVGALILGCSPVDPREKHGFIACTIAAFIATIAVIIGATKGSHVW